jgi:hypothetical protein
MIQRACDRCHACHLRQAQVDGTESEETPEDVVEQASCTSIDESRRDQEESILPGASGGSDERSDSDLPEPSDENLLLPHAVHVVDILVAGFVYLSGVKLVVGDLARSVGRCGGGYSILAVCEFKCWLVKGLRVLVLSSNETHDLEACGWEKTEQGTCTMVFVEASGRGLRYCDEADSHQSNAER